MFCRHCGKGIPEDSRFCPYCGEGADSDEFGEGKDTGKEPERYLEQVAASDTVALTAEETKAASVKHLISIYERFGSGSITVPFTDAGKCIICGSDKVGRLERKSKYAFCKMHYWRNMDMINLINDYYSKKLNSKFRLGSLALSWTEPDALYIVYRMGSEGTFSIGEIVEFAYRNMAGFRDDVDKKSQKMERDSEARQKKQDEIAQRRASYESRLRAQEAEEESRRALEAQSKPQVVQVTDPNAMHCPKCGCTSLSGNKKGYGAVKGVGGALAGAAIAGPVGLALGAGAGNVGRKKVVVTCMRCGHKWKA